MNILVLGNGFDLSHGLSTQYRVFLHFVKVVQQIIKEKSINGIDWGMINDNVKR